MTLRWMQQQQQNPLQSQVVCNTAIKSTHKSNELTHLLTTTKEKNK